jgi:SAM-dependent methyltransferase
MPKQFNYIQKECLFCDNTNPDTHPVLYKKNFEDADLNAHVFSARRTTEHYHYEMVKCQKTGLIFSRAILTDESLEDLYQQSLVTFGEQTEYIKKDYWNPIAALFQNRSKQRSLDIGCSNGFFLEVLKDNGFTEVYGCEPSKEAKAIARQDVRDNIHTGFYVKGLYPENYFDLVTCFQTLDHLSNPLEMLQQMHFNTKKGGIAYLIMHNTEAPQAKFFGEKSPIIDVEHIYLFNKTNLPLLCQKAGFKVISVFDLKNGYPLSYWLRMAPLPLKGFWTGLVKMLGLYNKVLSISAGNMGIILEKY